MEKAELAVSDIVREMGGAKVEARKLDLADTKSICEFAENIYNSGLKHTHTTPYTVKPIQHHTVRAPIQRCSDSFCPPAEKVLHFLINNAGVATCPYSTTVDGYEMQLGVNHLGTRQNGWFIIKTASNTFFLCHIKRIYYH